MLLMSGLTMIMSTQYTAVLYLRLHATALEAQRTAVCSAHLRRPPFARVVAMPVSRRYAFDMLEIRSIIL